MLLKIGITSRTAKSWTKLKSERLELEMAVSTHLHIYEPNWVVFYLKQVNSNESAKKVTSQMGRMGQLNVAKVYFLSIQPSIFSIQMFKTSDIIVVILSL